MLRTMVGFPPQKSCSVTTELVTLQRPPPLTRILAPSFFAPSRTATERAGFSRRVKIAVASPAAPPPMTAISKSASLTDTIFRHAGFPDALGGSRVVGRRAGRHADACVGAADPNPTVRHLRRIGNLPSVSSSHLRPVDQNADGECGHRSARPPR